MNNKNTLNILNGQSMYNYFKLHHLNDNGLYVPFNEAMCVGKVTSDIFSDEFNECRCSVHNVTMEQYNELILKQVQTISKNQFSHIVLWFDEDMFCQINLLTLLGYLNQTNFCKEITFNLVGEKFKLNHSFKLDISGYSSIYKQVMINKRTSETNVLPVMGNGIRLYLEYLKEENEITIYIKEHIYLQMDILITKLLKKFPQYGLGDTQYTQLIKKYKESTGV